ncbi:unnamed protein product [Aphanomyces euteiches]|uniref:NmrA-like domain-containing protein n=1 Tax=Aphanomyces euteiches TaxID=100861 RepID=A0A6G0WQZ4_9STRA|nr:hypothetical protein Ae201684_012508 [Aphanomyces euteiches]KAF0729865.1 hypothetical protein Ae201684_012509 [Aphanomyces euteiches]KAH9090398.1 hypothetical protein Ae201684P_014201 [Aphanomyces euteiches]KAH9090607.1 hypothetical protein Ae201684P_014403 [Aphanomyces euteiches]
MSSTLLVTGASGQLGKLVIHHLLTTLAINPDRIVAGTRDPTKLQELANQGVRVRKVDFKDSQTVTAAAAGVDRVLLISVEDLLGGGDVQNAAVDAFAKAGVKHIVYTSLQGLEKTLFTVKAKHASTEAAIKSSNIPYSILRNGLYFENNIGSIVGALKTGQWFSAAKDGKVSSISRDDLARAAAHALASDNTDNVTYELTGPEALSVDEIVAQISETVEKPIQVVQVSVPDLSKGIAAATGMPSFIADVLASTDESTAAGVAGDVTDNFEKLTGVKARTHREWLEANKAFLKSL